MKIVKLPKMEDNEIEEALKKENLCRIAFIEDKFSQAIELLKNRPYDLLLC